MRIIEEEQLDFDDLMMSPKRSTLNSRSEVSLLRMFSWQGTDGHLNSLNCIPIIIANMGTIGTPKMATIAAKRGFMCALEKHLLASDILKLYDDLKALEIQEAQKISSYRDRVMPTFGLKESVEILSTLKSAGHEVKCVCIDVPNGYVPNFINKVREVRAACPNALIFAGNVVTSDICQDIILAGGNVAKVGIGPGCFLGNMKVLTISGLKKIQDIEIGEKVLSHTGKFETVLNKFTYNTHKKIIDINGIKCTPNHKFYVAKIEDIDKITKSNYKDYCIWIEAQYLDTSKYKLIKITPDQV